MRWTSPFSCSHRALSDRQLALRLRALLGDRREPIVVVRADGGFALEHAALHGEILEPALRRLDRRRRRVLA